DLCEDRGGGGVEFREIAGRIANVAAGLVGDEIVHGTGHDAGAVQAADDRSAEFGRQRDGCFDRAVSQQQQGIAVCAGHGREGRGYLVVGGDWAKLGLKGITWRGGWKGKGEEHAVGGASKALRVKVRVKCDAQDGSVVVNRANAQAAVAWRRAVEVCEAEI